MNLSTLRTYCECRYFQITIVNANVEYLFGHAMLIDFKVKCISVRREKKMYDFL